MSNKVNSILVKDVMLKMDKFPIVRPRTLIIETIEEMNKFGIGIACVVNENMILKAVFCDGDIRRTIVKNQQSISAFFIDDVLDYSVLNFKSVKENTTLFDAIKLMGDLQVWDLPIVDSNSVIKGLLHLHPAILYLLESSRKNNSY